MIFVGDWAPDNDIVNINLPQNHYVINLETPILIEAQHKIAPKAGPSISNHLVPKIPKSKLSCVLANNHIMDFGVNGLSETIEKLDSNGIKHCGAGLSSKESNKLMILDFGYHKVGVLSYCETQFGISDNNNPGVNPLSPNTALSIIRAKSHCDYLVISVHAGLEKMPLPSPYLRMLYKSFIEMGADLIHGHHSHIPQGFETYNGKQIYYGLGNFMVPYHKWSSLPNATWSYGIRLLEQDGVISSEIEIFEITALNELIVSTGTNRLSRINHINSINEVLVNEDLYNSIWHDIAIHCFNDYGEPYLLTPVASRNGIKKQIIKRITGQRDMVKIQPKQALLLKHLFSCESHREIMITALSILGDEIRDLRNTKSKLTLESLLSQA